MRSDKQNRASKTNGKKSNGPITDNGKANSARNATTHNLSASRLALLSTEDEQEFNQHQVGFLNRFQPIDTVEYDLVQKMICASWRERRIAAMEVALFEVEMERQRADVDLEFEAIAPAGRQVLALFGTTDASTASGLLLRYAAAARRAYADAFRILRELQGDRLKRSSNPAPFTPIEYLPPAQRNEPSSADAGAQEPSVNTTSAVAAASPGIRMRRSIIEPAFMLDQSLENSDLPNEPKPADSTTAASAFKARSAHAAAA